VNVDKVDEKRFSWLGFGWLVGWLAYCSCLLWALGRVKYGFEFLSIRLPGL
jgi:hypothetical protein